MIEVRQLLTGAGSEPAGLHQHPCSRAGVVLDHVSNGTYLANPIVPYQPLMRIASFRRCINAASCTSSAASSNASVVVLTGSEDQAENAESSPLSVEDSS